MLKRLLLGVLVFVVLGGVTAAWLLYSPKPPAPLVRAEAVTMTVDKRTRSYLLVAPPDAPPHSPVLLVLHPSRGDAAEMRRIVGGAIERITAADHPLIVYPDGFEGHFNDCRRAASYSARTAGIDDVAFMRAIVDRLVTERQADPRRVFALGYSNGGQLAVRLTLEAPDLLAGAIVISANLPTVDNLACRIGELPTRRLVFIEGTSDRINPFNGGPVTLFGFASRGNVRPARASAAWFANTLGLLSSGSQPLAMASGLAAYHEDWIGPEARVMLVTIQSGGHTVPQAAYRFPRILGKTFRSDAVLESAWQFVASNATAEKPDSKNP